MSFLSKLTAAAARLFTTDDAVMVEHGRRRQVQETLWREWQHTDDLEYKQRLGRLVGQVQVSWEIQMSSRPLAMEVEDALRQACDLWPEAVLWPYPLRRLDEQRQQPASATELIALLDNPEWEIRFVARHTLAWLGGEAVPSLLPQTNNNQSALRSTADWLLRSIEADTTSRLWPQAARLVCPRCLVRCHAHWVDIPGPMPLGYYGCRACGQSREFLEWTGHIVTVLDSAMAESYVEQDNIIRGNWLKLRSLFDCNRVEIIQASDEDIERFAVQVGNDTDELRQPRYAEMTCSVMCQLSENTQRILQHTFGEVRQVRETTNER